MNFRQKLLYTALGAVIMLLGILAANHLTPITAQPQATHFDEIICKRLTVINHHPEKGEAKITLSADAGTAWIKTIGDKDLSARLDLAAGYHHAKVSLIGKDQKSGVSLYADHDGGVVNVDSESGNTGVRLAADDMSPGGVISIFNDNNEEVMDMFAGGDDHGVLMVHSKDGLSAAILTADDKGGRVTVHGKEGYGGVELYLDEKGGIITKTDAATKIEGY